MSLSDFSADWHQQVHRFDEAELQQAFLDVCLIEATNERQEALAVAIAMREVLETPGKTAALVTPDRNLSRRVSMELMRYGIRVDDSAGVPLANTSAAVFIRQLLELVFTDCDKPNLTSLNKNPLTTLGFPIEQSGKLARQFEVIALRGTIHTPQPGAFVGFLQDRQERLASEKHVSSLIRQLTSDDWQAQFERCKRLDQAFEPLIVAKASEEEAVSLRSLAEALRKTVLSLTRLEGKASTFTNAHGAPEIDRLLEDMTNGNSGEYSVPIREVPRVFDALLAGKVCRSGVTSHSRLHILGPLEVRLQNYDRVILSGLNEDTWPRSLRNDIFINRSMRRQIGLPSPERRTGLAAHDFQQLIGKSEVVLSRSGRVDKAPTVASRWVQRLLALIGPDHAKHLKQRGNAYLAYAEELDRSETQSVRASRAEACPPVAARPKSLAVTDIESWIRDPYALYAKKVLRLSPVDPLEREPDALLKGTIYHAVMEEYVLADYSAMPAPERASILIGLAEKYLEAQNLPSDVQKLWQLRFGNVARAFVMWEDEHFSDGRPLSILTEVEGKVPLADGAFELRARADRLELNAESVHVLDYKTGNSPTTKQARSLSPQLALEGLIAQEGGFEGLPARPVGDLSFIRLREGDKFRVESIEVRKKTETVPVQEIIQSARESLEALVAAYQNSSQTYISRFAPFQEGEMGNDYDHLARTREWSFGEDGDDDE